MSRSALVFVLGATGRLGRALGRVTGDIRLVGCARGRSSSLTALPGYEALHQLDRADTASLSETLSEADVVIDLCAFNAHDCENIFAALRGRAARRVVLASSVAERPPERWLSDEPEGWDSEPLSGGAYGEGKREARVRAELLAAESDLSLATVLLPQIVCPDDPQARDLAYVREAQAGGPVSMPGDGDQRPCVATVEQAAEALLGLALHIVEPGTVDRYQLAPTQSPRLSQLVEALLQGAGVEGELAPGRQGRGPHSGATERVQGGRLRTLLPAIDWSGDRVLRAYRALGASQLG